MRRTLQDSPSVAHGRSRALVITAAMFVAILGLQFLDDDPFSGALYTVPVALLAVNFGARGGLAGAAGALGLLVLWSQSRRSTSAWRATSPVV